MVAASKLYEHIKYENCQGWLHSGSCQQQLFDSLRGGFMSNVRYFAPVILMSLLIKIKKLNRERLLDTLKYYAISVLTGTSIHVVISTIICIFRQWLGHFNSWSFSFVPIIGGGIMPLLAYDKTWNLYKITIFQILLESQIIKQRNVFTKAIANSKLVQTLLFMWSSRVIMESQLKGNFNGFWFVKPENPAKELQHENEECSADYNNQEAKQKWIIDPLVIKSIKNYAYLGLTLDIIKSLMLKPEANVVGFFPALWNKLKRLQLRTTPFLVSYVGIYKLLNSYLTSQAFKHSSPYLTNHGISSFLAGICFIFYSKMTIMTYALTVSLDILWKEWKNKKDSHDSDFVKTLKTIPFDKLFYPLALAHLVTMYVMKPKYISSFAATVFNGITDNYALHFMKMMAKATREVEGKL